MSAGLAPRAARWRADHQSDSVSSPRTVTACSMRSLKWRVLSSPAGHSGAPKVTVVLPGLGRFMPLPRMEPAPSMNTGTTGAPVRMDR